MVLAINEKWGTWCLPGRLRIYLLNIPAGVIYAKGCTLNVALAGPGRRQKRWKRPGLPRGSSGNGQGALPGSYGTGRLANTLGDPLLV